ncbi:MAG: hypothetical protein C3F11_10530 [Methylocystaceae bacterium]|nr:MAG: hypothetical protein C3F11_10530 [Methylocystaceae bacterium]
MDITAVDPKLPVSVGDPKTQREAIARALRRAAHKAQMPMGVISGGAGFRARKGEKAFRWGIIASFFVMVACPLAAASIYWGLLATKQFSTETKFALRAGEPSVLDSLGGLAGIPASLQAQDTQIVANYIRSRAIVEALDKELDLRRVFSRPEADYFSRLDRRDSIEDLEKYWRKRVDTSIDALSGIISVNVRAFTPQDSMALMAKVVDLSEKLVNDLSTRSRRDALEQAKRELSRAEKRLKDMTVSMRDTRDAEGVIDATAAAEAINTLITTLRVDLSHAEESLAVQRGSVAQDAPQIKILDARIQSLKSQIAYYSGQIAGVKDDGAGNMAGRLKNLSRQQVELDIARQQYALAAVSYETARVDMETQQAYLVSFLRPTLAEKSTYPRRWWEWSIIVAPAVTSWLILVAVAFVARDHMAK